MSGVEVRGLVKALGGRAVLDGVDLVVADGSLTVVLGPSGSGKTTLLRVLAGFEPADGGSITIGDEIVDGGGRGRPWAPKRRRIGYVPQEGALFPHLTVADNVGFGLRRGPARLERVIALIELVGLAELANRYPHQLSGGQQQRVALARALAVSPPVVLLDEPFASLDPRARSNVRADVTRILKETGTTALLVTHDQDEALSIADVVAVLHDGKIAQQSAPRDLYARPGDVATAHFVGGANLLEGTALGTSVQTAFGTLALLLGTPSFDAPTAVVVLVRPEQIHVMPVDDPGDQADGPGTESVLRGRIEQSEFFGHDHQLTVVPDGAGGPERIVAHARAGQDWSAGRRVELSVRVPVHIWPRESTDPPVSG
jgi:iron(III) transport system ATP-binding protein